MGTETPDPIRADRDEKGNITLPERIHTYGHAADAALALAEFFTGDAGFDDDTLAHLANTLQSVCRARVEHADEALDDETRYGSRVTFVDDDGETHTALVMEPEVASMETQEAYDPRYDEFVNPQEVYPHGTVQLIYTPDFNLSDGFNFDRRSDLEVATSVPPAKGPDETYCYYAGWYAALADTETDANH